MKIITTILLLSLCITGFGQEKKDTVPTSILMGKGITSSSAWLMGTVNTKRKDTIDVIALVSDTSNIQALDITSKWTPFHQCLTIKCKAVTDGWGVIVEFIIPKGFIVWQSIILK